MRYLIDTHVFIGIDSTPTVLSPTAAQICRDPQNALFLSHVSIWEMQIKIGIGKLNLAFPLPDAVKWQQDNNGLQLLPIDQRHIYALARLPDHHRDPFDRLLIAQAQIENLSFLSRDAELRRYPITIVW